MLNKLLVAVTLLGSTIATTIPASADGWTASHPRRAEVNGRLANENHRINAGVRDGTITPREARHFRHEERAIRHEERAMAARHGGHLTPGEQRRLDHQEDRLSRQIRRERRY